MTAIISIGNEILLGRTLNSNLYYLADKLAGIGLPVDYAVTIKDDPEAVRRALAYCWENYDVVISTGGLGPTADDITKQCIADFFGAQLVFDEDIWSYVVSLFSRRNMKAPEINRNQALVPSGFKVLNNKLGTAPGLFYESEQKSFFALPGVPIEMKGLYEDHIQGLLNTKYHKEALLIRNIHTAGVSESALAELMSELQTPQGLGLAWLPQTGRVDIRLYSSDKNLITSYETKLLKLIGKHVWACDAGSPASVLHSILYKSGLKLAVAESCTGGLLSRLITDNSGSSDYFMGGVVSYHNDLKTCFLGVSEELLEEHGAVSEEVARAMLVGLFKHHRLDLGVAITGIAGPEGGTPEKPVGTVHFAFRDRGEVWSQKLILTGNREMIRIKAAEHALITMIRKLGAKIF